MYDLEVCSLSKRKVLSLYFTVNRVLMILLKLSRTSNINNIKDCIDVFDVKLPSVAYS